MEFNLWIGVDALELEISGMASLVNAGSTVAGESLSPIGAFSAYMLTGVAGDDFETFIGYINLGSNAFNDWVSGKTYVDKRSNELVFGQSTILAGLEQGIDEMLPANPYADVVSNVSILSIDLLNTSQVVTNFSEVRWPLAPYDQLEYPYLVFYKDKLPLFDE